MAQKGLNASQRRVFNSVFEKYTETLSDPTPSSTPTAGFTAPGQPFGGFRGAGNQHLADHGLGFHAPSETLSDTSRHVHDQVTWDRSWHAVTSWLSFHRETFNPYSHEDYNQAKASPPLNYNTSLLDVLTPET